MFKSRKAYSDNFSFAYQIYTNFMKNMKRILFALSFKKVLVFINESKYPAIEVHQFYMTMTNDRGNNNYF